MPTVLCSSVVYLQDRRLELQILGAAQILCALFY